MFGRGCGGSISKRIPRKIPWIESGGFYRTGFYQADFSKKTYPCPRLRARVHADDRGWFVGRLLVEEAPISGFPDAHRGFERCVRSDAFDRVETSPVRSLVRSNAKRSRRCACGGAKLSGGGRIRSALGCARTLSVLLAGALFRRNPSSLFALPPLVLPRRISRIPDHSGARFARRTLVFRDRLSRSSFEIDLDGRMIDERKALGHGGSRSIESRLTDRRLFRSCDPS